MRSTKTKKYILPKTAFMAGLLLAAGSVFAASTTVNLTAERMSVTLPDGNTVPMWGYCDAGNNIDVTALGGATLTGASTCSNVTAWMPGPTITIPYDAAGTSLTINLTNKLPTATSIVILGQLGGGLGTPAREASPAHLPQNVTWPAGDASTFFYPPKQAARARSFAPEAALNGGTNSYVWSNLKPGTYLYETGSHPSIQAPMGLYGLLVVTNAPVAASATTVAASGTAYPGINYDAEAAVLFSEIDPKQNTTVDQALTLACPGALADPCTGSVNEAWYPPAVNYTPIYFLVNGHSFDPTDANSNLLAISGDALTGKVLLRLANAGLHSHVPTTTGLPMSVVAEDGNVLPGNPKIKNQLLLPAGKTNDVLVSPPTASTTLPSTYSAAVFNIFDRELATSANKQSGGMQAVLSLGGKVPAVLQCQANNDAYTAKYGSTFFSGNVASNDRGLSNLTVVTQGSSGQVTLNSNGSFIYTPTGGATVAADTFTYSGTCAATNTAYTATVSLGVADAGVITALGDTYSSKIASVLSVTAPGVLANDTDTKNYKLTAVMQQAEIDAATAAGINVVMQADGSFTATPATPPTAATSYNFTYHAVNEQGVAAQATVTVNFTPGSGLQVAILDTQDKSPVKDNDYSWVIEEDNTYFADPANPSGSGTGSNTVPPQSVSTNFHKSFMPVVAAGCTGPRSCGDANTVDGGIPVTPKARSFPSDVVLDPAKRYFISVLPADSIDGDPDSIGTDTPVYGHAMGGITIPPGKLAVTVLTPRNPLPGGQISVIVFEDSGPTNGGVDDGEPGLGGFTINLFDTRGSTGDIAGQVTYDLAGMPLTNALAGTKATDGSGANLCPLPTPMGVVTTCPELDDQGNPSPLAGMALIKNVEPGRYDVLAIPGIERANKGETWVQVSTLEGTPVNDTFVKPGEPGYWQEFGSPGFHSFIGFINPDHVKQKQADDAAANPTVAWNNTITGNISSLHMDRPPAANLNDSCGTAGTVDATCRAALSYTTCQVSVNLNGSAENISFAMCDQLGNFTLTGVPPGTHEVVIWDQWLDQIIAYKSVTVPAAANNQTVAMGSIPVFSWFTRIQQTAFIDVNGNGIQDPEDAGIPMIPLNVRFRDGSISNYLATDLAGGGGTNELFPLFNWYVLETDSTRYKGTKVHVVYDAGGKPDATGPYAGVLNSTETTSLPSGLQYPGSTYTAGTTERFDPGSVLTEGIQGFVNQTAVVDWGKQPYATGENGGITGMVYYGSTRALDDPQLETQLSWEPGVANVKINLYSETINADGSTSLALVDTTMTSSWDNNVNNMHCPGDPLTDPFVTTTLGAADQFKCYDGQHVFNQIQPAVYDGRYRFPSDPTKQLPIGKYVVEVVLPEGYEIVKEEDNNVFNGDSWMNPDSATQFAGVGNVFILKDQAILNNPYTLGSGAAFPPCVGRMHRVPDYLSLFPELQNNSPYAGFDRPLCDRKEVVLDDQSQGGADFMVFTPTMVAGHFTGIMLNDAAAEFDPFSPSFGEKAALPNAPIAIRDYNGIEIGRVYNDKYGSFNGMTVSTYDANVPNPSGYAPNMLTWCMNDPGPIPDPSGALDPATGQVKQIIDPMYNPMFSNFCYAWPVMPGQTSYLDTPVLPTAAFANASSYAPVDCQYPDTTPAIARVDSNNGTGPWVRSGGGNTITIQALGDVSVLNPAYGGPTALTAPANQPKITRHYGFGATQGTVKVNGTALAVISWSDTTITATVPANVTTGELVITAANNKQSIDAVTLHVVPNGTNVTVVKPVSTAVADGLAHPIQDAIDAANPGDLIILDAGSYPELVVMYKPVQLQGVGAASVVINATKYPNQKLRQWRTKINSLFGLDDQGNVIPGSPAVDPLIGQTITGGILQLEPTVLASEEGAGITVLAKGLRPDGVTPVTSGDCAATIRVRGRNVPNPNYTPNSFFCGASLIDGVTVTGGDAGGGIYVNGWAHNLEIANNRVYGNAGPFNGGVRIGQPYLEGQALPNGNIANFALGYDLNVNIHNNAISTNGMVEGAPGATAAANAGGAGGGLSICAGSDNYKVTGNWICGNYSSADGGGIGHVGLSNNGTIAKNFIIFNESYNQTGLQSGGGIAIEGDNPGGLGSGNVTVDSNVILGNFARAGHGGGIRLQGVNGEDVTHASGNGNGAANNGWRVKVINNMISNNVAGWSGGGISLADATNSVMINNTIASNDSMGMTGNLFNTMINGVSTGPTTGIPNPAGVSSEQTSALLLAFYANNQKASHSISKPTTMQNNIIWQNRSFFFDMSSGVAQVVPSNNWNDAVAAAKPAPLAQQTATGECVAGAAYWDMGVVGDTNPGAVANVNLRLAPTYSVLTVQNGYPTNANNKYAQDPMLVKQYCNGSRVLPGLQFEPGTPFQPNFQLNAAATLDESGNFVDLHFGPISLTDPAIVDPTHVALPVVNGNYHLLDNTSAAYNSGSNANGAPNYDIDGDARVNQNGPNGQKYEIGADELAGAVSFLPDPLAFPDTLVGTTSAPLTATLKNVGTLAVVLAANAVTLSGTNATEFAIAAGTTCTNGLSLAPGASCVINVTFTPAGVFGRVAQLNVTDTVGTQSIGLQGVGAAPVVSLSATAIPFGTVTNNTTQFRVETVTNVGNAPLIFGAGAVTVTNNAPATTQFALAVDNCSGQTIAIGGTCTVTVSFTPTSTANRSGTLRFTDNAIPNTQTVALSGR